MDVAVPSIGMIRRLLLMLLLAVGCRDMQPEPVTDDAAPSRDGAASSPDADPSAGSDAAPALDASAGPDAGGLDGGVDGGIADSGPVDGRGPDGATSQ